MPKINTQTSTTYGNSPANNSLTFRERLMERFSAHEYVRVINCDDEPVRWQYLPSHAEEFTFTADPMKITHRGDVEVYMLNPGESEVLLGECAYLMIETLYKQIAAKKTIDKSPDLNPGQARNFNFTDAAKQEEWIEKIYLGRETPHFGEVVSEPQTKEATNERPAKSKVEKDLQSHLKEQVA